MVEHILNKAKHFTSDSVFMADEMNRIANKKLDTTIANFGINITITGEAKENWIYSNRAHHALYRIDEIIKAFSKFSTKTIANNWKLVIAGEGELTPTLKELSKQLGITKKVDFVGWLNKDQNSSFYQKARLYVSIPTSDATSISLLEAMASGCIPVVSDLPANAEWITDGINGVVVKNLAEDFLERALQLDYDLVKKTNSEIINRDGTREANRNKFVHLYDSILK
jgi:glycosyltransferase involved in cell wall biosynthesis